MPSSSAYDTLRAGPQSPASPLWVRLNSYHLSRRYSAPSFSDVAPLLSPKPLPPPSEPLSLSPAPRWQASEGVARACLEDSADLQPTLLPFTQSSEGRMGSCTETALEKHNRQLFGALGTHLLDLGLTPSFLGRSLPLTFHVPPRN